MGPTTGNDMCTRQSKSEVWWINTLFRYMDAIGNFKERNAGRMPLGGDEQYLQMLQQTV